MKNIKVSLVGNDYFVRARTDLFGNEKNNALITCSRCGKRLIFFIKSILISDNKNDRLCYACYQNMFFPVIKEYDTEMLY